MNPPPIPTLPENPASALCSSCGFCCDGTLFDQVSISPSDAPRSLAAHGAKLKKEKTILPQPCSAFQNSSCSLYDIRPSRCKLFVCKLLHSLSQNKISLSQALATTHQASAEIEKIKHSLLLANETRTHKPLHTRIRYALADLSDSPPEPDSPLHTLSVASSSLPSLLAPFQRHSPE